MSDRPDDHVPGDALPGDALPADRRPDAGGTGGPMAPDPGAGPGAGPPDEPGDDPSEAPIAAGIDAPVEGPAEIGPGPVDGFEALLTSALTVRAGGPFARADDPGRSSFGTGGGPSADPADEGRLAAIERGVRAPDPSRRPLLLGAAAAVVVLLVGVLALTRSPDDTELRSDGDQPATTAGTDPAVVGPDPSVIAPPAPTSTETTAPVVTLPDPHIGATDLRNFTYPTSVCSTNITELNGPLRDPTFTLVDGEATMPGAPPNPSSYSMYFGGVVHGDVTGDGIDDAVVQLSCGLHQSDGIWGSLAIISLVDGTPAVIGSLDRSGYAPLLDFPDPQTGEVHQAPMHEYIVEVRAVGGQLVVRWNRAKEMFAPTIDEQRLSTVAYRWDGTGFVPLGETDIEVIPPTEPPPLVPIEEVDFLSIEAKLDHARWGETHTLCGFALRGTTPVDTVLVDGKATIRDPSGADFGSVAIEEVVLVNLDDDEAPEALAKVRCTVGITSVLTAVVFEPGLAQQPNVFWSSTEVNGYDTVADVRANPGQVCVLTVDYGWAVEPTYPGITVDYRRLWATYQSESSCPPS